MIDEDPTMAETDDDEELPRLLPRGACIGRYIVSDVLGQGGMGVVYRAFDPDLGRPVALKMLTGNKLPMLATEASALESSRLLREAQALAKLSHPNVVTIHDVGIFEDLVFLAMELVEGLTLSKWLRVKKRSTEEILTVLIAAGQGLAAAHEAGIIHRDFKPGNVIVGHDRRVRVLDFGLARASELAPDSAVAEAPEELDRDQEDTVPASGSLSLASYDSSGSVNFLSSSLTQVGSIMGTRNYMAPEQFKGKNVDARTDQFAFCVTLYKALHGLRPFRGRSAESLVINILEGNVVPPKKPVVPVWMMRVILRGLEGKPADRFGSMNELLTALGDDPVKALEQARSTKRRRILWALAAMLFVGSIVFGLWYGKSQASRLCQGAEEKLRGLWDEDAKKKVAAAFLATQRSYAQDNFDRVAELFDRRAEEWVKMHTEVCRATQVTGEQSAQMMDLKMSCLNRRRSEWAALVALFSAGPDPEVLNQSLPAVFKLSPLGTCRDEAALSSALPPPVDPRTGAELEVIRAGLAEAKALHDAGKYQKAGILARGLLLRARASKYPPVLGEVLLRLGKILDESGEYTESEKVLREAAQVAQQAKDAVTAIEALCEELWVVGVRQAHYDQALTLKRVIETTFAFGGENPNLRAHLQNVLGKILHEKDQYQAAKIQYQRARQGWEKSLGPDHPQVAMVMGNLSSLLADQGKYEDALVFQQQALAIQERALGPEHPKVAATLNRLGISLYLLAKYDRAEKILLRALAILEKTVGATHSEVAFALGNLGSLYFAQGKNEQAKSFMLRSLQVAEKVLGPKHPKVANSYNNLGTLYSTLGEYDQAIRHTLRALKIWEEALGPEHSDVAYSLGNLGNLFLKQGQHAKAQEYLLRAQGIFSKALGAEHPLVATCANSLGKVAMARSDYQTAKSHFQRALRIWQTALGPQHPQLISPLAGIVEIEQAQGKRHEVRIHLAKILKICAAVSEPPEKCEQVRNLLKQ